MINKGPFLAPSLLLLLTGCSAEASLSAPSAANTVPFVHSPLMRSAAASGKIQHVVIVVQENRSFDNLFYSYPGANTVASGLDHKGHTIPLQPITLQTSYDIDHTARAFFTACDGTGSIPGTDCKNDAFDQEVAAGGPPNPQYAYVPHRESKPYFDIAKEFVLGDNTFTSQIDMSFVAHQYLIAAQAASSVDLPSNVWGCDGGVNDVIQVIKPNRTYSLNTEQVCFDYRTLADELDQAGLSWRFYTSKLSATDGAWSAFQAVRHIRYGDDWKNDVITPQKRFLSDVAAGQLANVTWITPTCKNSDHISCMGKGGPSWVANIVNAVGESPFWSSTAIFVIWDDWGGLYDHVPPPFEDYDGLGFRVPLLIVSPYAKEHHVSHVQYETASILRFTEDQFGLGQLSASDTRATSPAKDSFNFNKPPRAFVPIQAPLSRNYFLHEPEETGAPDNQ